MNDTETSDLPIFPTEAPEAFLDATTTKARFQQVLTDLATVVEVGDADLDRPTPCQAYDVSSLRHHVLGWLQFFAAALNDPDGATDRLDPEIWTLDQEAEPPAAIVERAAASIAASIDAGVAEQLVVMSQARMSGDGVLAMALGEYLVHGWDLAVATGRDWPPARGDVGIAGDALAFLQTTVAPEYRGPDSGFFDHEIEAPAGATTLERLLCFGGRQLDWGPGVS